MISIITGDIIKSRTQQSQKQWQTPLKKYLNTIGTNPKQWQIYGGDSFQLEVKEIGQSLQVCLMIRAILSKYANLNTRMAIGIGDKNHNAPQITESNGSAFVDSGLLLQTLKKTNINIAIKTPWEDWDKMMNLMMSLAQISIDKWTPTVSELWILMNEHPNWNQNEYAKKLKISQASVSDRKNRGSFDKIIELRTYFENALK